MTDIQAALSRMQAARDKDWLNFADWRERSHLFSGMAIVQSGETWWLASVALLTCY